MDSSRPIRLRLSSGGGLRALRWFGRLLSLGTIWPLWYSFFGKTNFNWDAMLVGGPGLLLGLALWWWSGYRLRNPTTCLEIDHREDLARLHRHGAALAVCDLDALGGWSYRTWQTTSTNDGVQRTTTWYAARCEGLGDHDLYVDTTKSMCVAWAERVDLVVRQPGKLEAEEPLASGIDRKLQVLVGWPVDLLMSGLTIGWFVLALPVVAATHGDALEAGASLAAIGVLLTLGWAVAGRLWASGSTTLLMGIPLALKPWVAPVTSEFMGEILVSSPTSETHLYSLLPGLALVGIGALILFNAARTSRVVEPSRTAGAGPVATKLPRPKPPGAGR